MKKTIRFLLANVALLSISTAWAEDQVLQNNPSAPDIQEVDAGAPIFEREQLLGEWLPTHPLLTDRGLSLFGGYTVEVWGNTSGGLDTGAVYTGLLDFGAELDLEKALGWQGASMSTTWLWLSGRDASEDLV